MTRERRLAAEMWYEMADRIHNMELQTFRSKVQFKRSFIERYDLHWLDLCWFCQYVYRGDRISRNKDGCSACPLYRKGLGYCFDPCSHFMLAMRDNHGNGRVALQQAIYATEIARTLGGNR